MRAALVPPVPLEPQVTITMSKRDAQILRSLAGGIEGDDRTEAGRWTIAVWDALSFVDEASHTESFSDFFRGTVRAK